MRYGYHATAISERNLYSIIKDGLVPGGGSAGGRAVRDAVHLCPLHLSHEDAVGIWAVDKADKADKKSWDGMD
eukprot:4941846-Amphidinium_carterae.1